MKIIGTLFLMVVVAGTFAQQPAGGQDLLPVFNSPEGVVILFGGSSISAAGKDNEGTHFMLSRAEAGSGNYASLPITGMVKDMSSFKKITGAAFVASLEHQLKLGSDGALWAYLQQHPDLSAYGLASFNIPFRVAMGAAYIDVSTKGQQGRTYIYRMTVDGAGQAASSFETSLTIGGVPDFGAARLTAARSGDSSVTLRWRETLKRQTPYFATVYRQTGGKGEFQRLNTRIVATHKGDSAVFVFTERVRPNTAYRYFIRPADLLDNAGALNSDTASLIVANFKKLPMLSKLKARDTLNGIGLSWKALAANPLITGIEIQRSRDPRGDFVVIDTAGPMAASYMDRRLLPHIAYYYRLCVLHAGAQQQQEKFYTSVSLDQQKTSQIPDAPYGFAAAATDKGVTMHWQPSADPDGYAYYVYRGTSQTKMEVVSPALTDTFFIDTTSNLSRHTNYVYAVTAVSNASKESPFSEKIAAHLPKGVERPATPGGIRLTAREGKLFIQWDDVKAANPAILGYILYKHAAGKPLTYDVNSAASVEATRLGLQPVLNGAILTPYFEDSLPQDGVAAEYLVSAIDSYGVESGLSPSTSTAQLGLSTIRPPVQVMVSSVREGVTLRWQQADMTGVKGFVLYRRAVGEKQARAIIRVGGAVSQYTDRQTQAGTLYVYTISALGVGGESAPGNEYTIRK